MSYNSTGEIMRSVTSASGIGTRRALCLARGFLRCEEGVALVEFAIALPMMLFVFAVIVEGSRLLLSYEAAIAGIRDAARYLARTVDADICTTGGSVAGFTGKMQSIVADALTGDSVFASGVTVDSVTPSYGCVSGSYRNSPVAVAAVTAQITVTFPFSGVFALVGESRPTLTTTVTDHSRVFGS